MACSFCGLSRLGVTGNVLLVVRGPGDVAICCECVELCSDIIAEKRDVAETLIFFLMAMVGQKDRRGLTGF